MSPLLRLGARILRTADKRLLWKFVWNFGVKGMLSVERFKRRLKRGEYFPPFLYLSIVNSCNLRCQGCWVDVESPREMINIDDLNKLVRDAKKHGNSFFGSARRRAVSAPAVARFSWRTPRLLLPGLHQRPVDHRESGRELRRLGNVTPLVSIEGREIVSDERRGSKNVLNRTLRGLDNCLEARLLTGVATSVCQTNIDELLTESWLRELIARGVHYVWYHTYRPGRPKNVEPARAPSRPARGGAALHRPNARPDADRHHRRLLRRSR